MKTQRLLLTVLLALLFFSTAVVPVAAQNDVTVISVAMPELIQNQISDEVFAQFEAEHPGIRVHRVNKGEFAFGTARPTFEVNEHLDRVEDYVSAADVVAITPTQLTPEATRADYYLDMTPLLLSDPDTNPDDFYPVMYESYQWDGGFWALPISTDVVGLVYRPEIFDAAGIDYPQSWWTMDDFENAMRALAEYDSNGDVVSPAFVDLTGNISLLFHSILGQGVYDASITPSVPSFDDPALQDLITRWIDLQEDGFIGSDANIELTPPMALAPSLFAYDYSSEDEGRLELTALPGGAVGLNVNGFAISAGTLHPEAAYELIAFLTQSPEVANAFVPMVAPARRDMGSVDAEFDFADLFDIDEAIATLATDNGLSVAETRFGHYMTPALNQMLLTDANVVDALRDAEAAGITRLDVASERADDVTIVVDTPPLDVVLNEGDISLRFGMDITSLAGIPHRERWDDVIAEFVANDPDVGEIILRTPNIFDGIELAKLGERFDCYYLFSNVVQSANITYLLPIDPLLLSDPNFDMNDFPANVMANVQRDGQTWALPLVIQPQVMAYNPQALDRAGASYPYFGWTTTDFETMLRTLKINEGDPAPFAPLDITGSYIFALIASYGGLPLDYRTNPVTIDFTDEATVNAIRQVLDLAKDGYIEYSSLTDIGFNSIGIDIENSEVPLFSIMLNEFFFDLSGGSTTSFAMVEFPQGQTYTSLVYDLGAGYISANTDNPEACYRFISAVSRHPELFTGMPARRSELSNPILETTQGASAVEFYGQMDTLINRPNAVLFPTGFSNNLETIREYLMFFWLFRAFDRYILEDADLETELEDAEFHTLAFQQCIDEIPAFEPGDNLFGYFRQYTKCATDVDPTMEGTFISI